MELFPEKMKGMYSKMGSEMTLESIAEKLGYFREQLELLHWQTTSYAEHKATGELYDFVDGFKDDVVEKLMGYMGKRPQMYKRCDLMATTTNSLVSELGEWAYELYEWAGMMKYCDVENMAQELSGQAAKTKYLLTLS